MLATVPRSAGACDSAHRSFWIHGDTLAGAMMSACGVRCSQCPAYLAAEKGEAHQKRVAEAWRRIYQLDECPENISCGGCLGPDEKLFHASRECQARRCCCSQGLATCAECSVENCADLEKAQRVWDEVPDLAKSLSRDDFKTYARPYCGHRQRLAAARAASSRPQQ